MEPKWKEIKEKIINAFECNKGIKMEDSENNWWIRNKEQPPCFKDLDNNEDLAYILAEARKKRRQNAKIS